MNTEQYSVYGNTIPLISEWRAKQLLRKYKRRYKQEATQVAGYKARRLKALEPEIGLHLLESTESNQLESMDTAVIIGTIRMGYGHYRMAIAAASAARAMGIEPYLLDFSSVDSQAATDIFGRLNRLYGIGTKLSRHVRLFNALFWEPFTSDLARNFGSSVRDRLATTIFTGILTPLPKNIPFIATHPWTGHTAVNARMERIITMVPDNFPLGFHICEGSIHCVQTPSSYLGYRSLKDMGFGNIPDHPMPPEDIVYAGHFVDHELVSNIEIDCENRIRRVKDGKPRRILMSLGGTGAEQNTFSNILGFLANAVKDNKAVVFANVGEHQEALPGIRQELQSLDVPVSVHTTWDESKQFARNLRMEHKEGVHLFVEEDPFSAVYLTNLLMRSTDLMITKPSELSFYPVPKLFIERIGRHEEWGAIRGAEIGDGTSESRSIETARHFLTLIIEDDDIIPFFCRNIMNNKKAGIYDGAYRVIEQAIELHH